jgi:hypothetical protein
MYQKTTAERLAEKAVRVGRIMEATAQQGPAHFELWWKWTSLRLAAKHVAAKASELDEKYGFSPSHHTPLSRLLGDEGAI